MRLVRLLPERVRALAPEALRFGAVGLANTLLYFLIFNLTMGIGAVKATVIATVVTTTLSYLANRHWTYKNRPKTDLRREYTLFFAFNLAGMFIQSGVVAIGKYGLGFSESSDRLAFNMATCVGIALGTLFRFFTYRTMVFKPAEAIGERAIEPAVDAPHPAPAAAAPALVAPQPRADRTGPMDDGFDSLGDSLDAELAAELAATELTGVELDRAAGSASG